MLGATFVEGEGNAMPTFDGRQLTAARALADQQFSF
jgi:hypothetical protein